MASAHLLIPLLILLPRGVVCFSGPGSKVNNHHDAVLGHPVPSEHLRSAAADGPRIPAAQATRHLTASEVSPGGSEDGHKPLFPVSGLEIAVLCIAGVVLFIAAGAGMGGGPVLVPLYLVAGLNHTAAVALSNSTILAGSVGNTLVNIFKRHPYKNKPMIDWDLVLLMEPPTLVGAIAGSYVNKLLPGWITSMLLVLLLGLMTVRVAQRAARIYSRETAARHEEAAAAAAVPASAGAGVAAAGPAAAAGGDTDCGGSGQHTTTAAPAALGGSLGKGSDSSRAVAGSSAGSESDLSGMMTAQLLAAERVAHVGPSDQLPAGSHSEGNGPKTTIAAGTVSGGSNRLQQQQQQQQQVAQRLPAQPQPLVPNMEPAGSLPATPSSPFAQGPGSSSTPFGMHSMRTGSNPVQQLSLGAAAAAVGSSRATPAPAPRSGAQSPAPRGGGLQPQSGYVSPFRSTLSSVPSSVLLNLELEGNISEAALQRLSMVDASALSAAAAAAAGGGGVGRVQGNCWDAADASLASMDGVGVSPSQQGQGQGQGQGQHWWQWQQHRGRQQQQGQQTATAGGGGGSGLSATHRQQQQQQQQVVVEEPPSEAECRLAYAPPDHTRRDSWELAWEEEQQDSAAAAATAQTAAARTAATGTGQTPVPTSAAVSASLSPDKRMQSPPAAAGVRSGAAAAGSGAVEMSPMSAQHQQLTPARTGSAPAPTNPPPAVAGAKSARPAIASNSSGRSISSRTLPGGTAAAGQSLNHQHGSGQQQQQQQQQAPKAPEVAAATTAAAVERMLAAEAAQVPLLPALLLLAMFLAVLLTSLLSKQAACGSAAYWAVQVAVVPLLAGLFWFSRRRVLAKVALKKQAQLDFHGEVRWTPRKSLVFPAICSIAGVIAGMFGLGGAVVKTPLMLELGVHPSVTAATTQTMLLLTSSASSIVYAQMGDTPWDWAAVMLPMAFAATLAGQAAIDWLVKKVGRSSLVVLVLAAFFIVATCLSIYTLSGAARAVAANPALLGQIGAVCK